MAGAPTPPAYPNELSQLKIFPFPPHIADRLRQRDLAASDIANAMQPIPGTAQQIADVMTQVESITDQYTAVRHSLINAAPQIVNNLYQERENRRQQATILDNALSVIREIIVDTRAIESRSPIHNAQRHNKFMENMEKFITDLSGEARLLTTQTASDNGVDLLAATHDQISTVQAAGQMEALSSVATMGLAWPRLSPFAAANYYMRRINSDIPLLHASQPALMSAQEATSSSADLDPYNRLNNFCLHSHIARSVSQEPPTRRQRLDADTAVPARPFSPSTKDASTAAGTTSSTTPTFHLQEPLAGEPSLHRRRAGSSTTTTPRITGCSANAAAILQHTDATQTNVWRALGAATACLATTTSPP